MKFETQTDTEVIPKLCKFLSDKFEESGEKDVTFRQLDGSDQTVARRSCISV